MAFGKDERLVSIGGNFRQTTNTFTTNKAREPKGRVPYFVDQYQPSLLTIDTVRLIPGQYMQEQVVEDIGPDGKVDLKVAHVVMSFIKFTEHFHGGLEKGGICSAGPFQNIKSKRAPCRGCDIFWETAAKNPSTGRFESNVMSRQNKYAFSVLDYGSYHKVDQIDRETGQAKVNPTTKEPYFNWVKCQGQGCDGCKASLELKQGDMRHWPMSYTHFQQLRAAELNIGASCARCGTSDIIQSIAWACPSCGAPAIDMATTELKLDEMLKITDNQYDCSDCGTKVFLTEHYTCPACAQRGQAGLRAGLFDVDLRVQLTAIAGQKGKTLQVRGWSPPRPVDPNFQAIVQPVDLPARYAPDSMAFQISRFGAPSATQGRAPVTGAPAQQQFATPYGPKSGS